MDTFDNLIKQAEKLNHTLNILSEIKSGKEATVYRAFLDDQLVAVKIYKDPEERAFKNTGKYLAGKYYRKPSQKKALEKNNAFGKKLKQENWVKREFFLLQKLFEKGESTTTARGGGLSTAWKAFNNYANTI